MTVAGDVTVGAAFALDSTLMVVRAGNGNGGVASVPAGINCGTDCEETYAANTVVTLTAVAVAGSTFTGWTGAGCSGTGTCVVTMDSAKMVTATFTLERFVLSVVLTGSGTGRVTSAPAGIDCGMDCSEAYDAGTMVTLTATAATGSTFGGWSGGGCSGTGTCTTTIGGATAVAATFTAGPQTLTVQRAGTGAGTVTSAPGGINCGVDCSESYAFGTSVVLTASPATGSAFTGWSGGGCSGTGTCTVSVTAATTVTATFTLTQHTLTVVRAGSGAGTVTSAGINCGTDCTETHDFGTTVVLVANAATGSTFAGWSGGGCMGTGACTTTITAAVTITATFTIGCPTGMAVFTYTGNVQTFTVPACVGAINVDARGGSGGDGWNVDSGGSVKGLGGNGGRITARLAVTGGEVLSIYVGGAGMNASTTPGTGGFNGGGNGAGSPNGYSGGGGGGASDIRRGTALTNRLIVAGGGGSGSGWCTSGAGNGGAGGGLIGADGQTCVGIAVGTGGTQSAGGNTGGVFGAGGSTGLSGAGSQAGAAGGGGWYGGGASNGSGGGGGSSFASASATMVTQQQGVNDGNGSITITW